MEEEARLILSLLMAAFAGFFIMGARFIIRDFNSRLYCACGDEYNEHYVVPKGMTNPMGSDKCRKCPCKAFNENKKDPRNTPPVKFW